MGTQGVAGGYKGSSRSAQGVPKRASGSRLPAVQNVVVPPLIAKVDSALMVPDVGTNVPRPPAPAPRIPQRAPMRACSRRAVGAVGLAPEPMPAWRRGGGPAVSLSAPLRVLSDEPCCA